MAETRATARRWGSSVAAVIPPDVLKLEGIRPGDEIVLQVRRAIRPEDVFGIVKGRKVNTQRLKDLMRHEDNE